MDFNNDVLNKFMHLAASAGCFMNSTDFLDIPRSGKKRKPKRWIKNNNTKFVGASKAKRASRKIERQNRRKGRK